MILLEELRGSKESAAFSFYLQDSNNYKKSYLETKNYIVLVAFIDDKVAGFMIAEHYTNDIANLVMLYVGKDYRKKGIAYQLKLMMEVLCYSRGYKKIVSQVRTNNTPSILLNLKAGWNKELDKVYPDYYYWFSKEL
jgi:ribosomal-protein-alanine N-acetyltransferase